MTLTEFICTEGIGNGLGFHDIMITSTLRLLGRFTTCLAQTTTASRLFFSLNGTSCLRNEKIWKFSILKLFSNFVPSR